MGITAKEKHTLKILEYLSNPDNEFPKRVDLAEVVCNIRKVTLYHHFTPEELTELEKQALDARRKKYASAMSRVDKGLIEKAESGDAQAAKLVYQRFEGWSEKNTHEHTGANGGPIETEFTIEFIECKKNKK